MAIQDLQNKLINEMILDIPLPPKPEVLLRFMEEKERDILDLDRFAQIISGDMSISLSLIKTVNSSFFGLANEVRSVNHAISLLGLENVSNLIMAFSLQKSLEKSDNYILKGFWDTNSTIALIAAGIAMTYTKVNNDLAYTFSLISDCGVPAIMRKESGYEKFYADSFSRSHSDIISLEESTYMYNHARVGSHLLKEWMLPDVLVDAVRHHHDRNYLELDISHEVKSLIAINNLASNVFSVYRNNAQDFYWHDTMKANLMVLDLQERSLAGIQNNFTLLLDNI